MSDIGWDPNLNRFVDLDNFMISTMFKLYPWELMMKEPFGQRLLAARPQSALGGAGLEDAPVQQGPARGAVAPLPGPPQPASGLP